MFEPKPDANVPLPLAQEDIVSTAVRITLSSALSCIGPFGAIISEFATQFIPRQRQDRIQRFVEDLNERFKGFETEVRARLESSPSFAVLTEEVCLSAVRTPSDERRKDLAALLQKGFSQLDAELAETLTLLRLLEGLNEWQVIYLMGTGNFRRAGARDERAKAFYEKHPGIFRVLQPALGDSQEAFQVWALHNHYLNDLVNKQLLKDVEGKATSGPIRHVAVTDLGLMLLDTIGRLDDDEEDRRP